MNIPFHFLHKMCSYEVEIHGVKVKTHIADWSSLQSTFSDTKTPAWSARMFSAEQIKLAIHDAYTVYLIGSKLLEKI
ncbi:hypothetical protein SLA2020_436030 [Shorea laevis]